jgi:hypothetical protein
MTQQDPNATAPTSWGEPRSRTVTWYDPSIGAGEGMAMAGLDYLQAMIEGVLPPPPISGLIDMKLVAAQPGRVEFTCLPDESSYTRSVRCTVAWSAHCWTQWPAVPCKARFRRAAAIRRSRSRSVT